MIKVLRKHRNWLMIVIAILALPFCIYFVKTDYSAIRPDQVAQIYGRTVSSIEVRRDARLFELARNLGMADFLEDTVAGTTRRDATKEEAYAQFAVNLIVLREEAERLGIHATQSEIVDVVRNLSAFRGASGFDPKQYEDFTQNFLGPNGFTEAQIEQLARDQICLDRIKQLLSAAVSLPESETKSDYEQIYGKNFVSVVRLRAADFAKEVKVTDDDIRKYYDTHKTELKTEEKRKVEFVNLSLTDEQKKLKDKERIDALQKLADRANDMSQALLEKGADFHQVATKFQLPVQATGEFTATAPDPKLKSDPQLSAAAFLLTVQEPNSDPIQTPDGFCILHLAGIAEARPLTIDEAKPKIVDAIKAQREREMVTAKGTRAVVTLREGLKSGAPLKFNLEKAGGLKAEKVEPFVLADELDQKKPEEKPRNEPPDAMMIKNAAAQVQPGEVSDFFPTDDGGIIVLLEKREPPDPAKYQQGKAAFDERYLKNKRRIVFFEWLLDRRQEAGVQLAKVNVPSPRDSGSTTN
jgi:peptidyl-prolyl cis-trans isomerase D